MKHKKAPKTSIIILAAGASSRLGSPKQLLEVHGSYLLQHIAEVSAASDADHVVVVLGAHHHLIESIIDLSRVQIVLNPLWEEGLSSSICCGLETVLTVYPKTEAVIFVLCDQPYLTTPILNELMLRQAETNKSIIQCRYSQAIGPPTLFYKDMFPHLMQLRGSQGAKSVANQFREEVAYVSFPDGDTDLDTASDYTQYLQKLQVIC